VREASFRLVGRKVFFLLSYFAQRTIGVRARSLTSLTGGFPSIGCFSPSRWIDVSRPLLSSLLSLPIEFSQYLQRIRFIPSQPSFFPEPPRGILSPVSAFSGRLRDSVTLLSVAGALVPPRRSSPLAFRDFPDRESSASSALGTPPFCSVFFQHLRFFLSFRGFFF